LSKLPIDVLAALSGAQMPPDHQMFSALAQLSSLSNSMSGGGGLDMGSDHNEMAPHQTRFKSSSSNNNTPKQGMKPQSGSSSNKTPSTSSSSSANNLHKSGSSSSAAKKGRLDDSAGFYQGLDLTTKQRSKKDSRAKSPLSDE
jgi:hypothetical protein